MNVTEIDLRRKFYELNKIYFNNDLDATKVQFKLSYRMTSTRGMFKPTKPLPTITISHLIAEADIELERTMTHEMIHYLQYQKGFKLAHDLYFKIKALDIKKINPELDIKRTAFFKDQKTAGKIENKRLSRNAGKPLYAVIRDDGEKVNFIRNISRVEKMHLIEKKGYVIKEINNSTEIRCCKNYQSLMTIKYYFPYEAVKDLIEG